ncbi:MAG: RCC1 domain-containing protein [Polyangiales bacterium]
MFSTKLRFSFLSFCTLAAGCHDGGDDSRADATSHDGAQATAAQRAPAQAPALLGVSASHACALRDTGLYCWGQNFFGQLGTGDVVDSESAVVATVAPTDIAQLVLSTGRTCVRRSTGAVACWGSNDVGQRGDGTRTESLKATEVVGVNDAVDLAMDDQTTCVVRGPERKVTCWGGSLDDQDTDTLDLIPIANTSSVVELRAGVNGEYCGRLEDKSVRCWSLEESGWTAAVAVPALKGARSIAMAAFDEVCGIVGDPAGPVLCHNLNNGATVPLNDSKDSVRVSGFGALSACAVNTRGAWACWNVLPQMLELIGSPRIDAPKNAKFVDFVLAGFHVCASYADGSVGCGDVAEWKVPELIPVQGLPKK